MSRSEGWAASGLAMSGSATTTDPASAPGAEHLRQLSPEAQVRLMAKQIRLSILEQSARAGVGHIGSGLSVADIVAALYARVLRVDGLADPERDRFVLSKGHAALALYAAFALRGWIGREQLDTYCGDDSLLGVHPERDLPGVDFSTGSLGHGLAMAAGAALAARLQGSHRRVYVLLSDAECNEGSLWESVMFAAHHRLGNLTAVIDLNGQQALGKTEAVLDLAPMAARWSEFGWDAVEANGHDPFELLSALQGGTGTRPRVVVARTTFGKGVSYMEGQLRWHYWPMSPEQYSQALEEVTEAP
ncbi:MAG TPA: transketolase [Actinomycetota bacterium]|nr:transketolase [Actinomycetota bacterium]